MEQQKLTRRQMVQRMAMAIGGTLVAPTVLLESCSFDPDTTTAGPLRLAMLDAIASAASSGVPILLELRGGTEPPTALDDILAQLTLLLLLLLPLLLLLLRVLVMIVMSRTTSSNNYIYNYKGDCFH